LFAPLVFRKELQRAIIAQDYADLVLRDFKLLVQRTAAALLWTGSWYVAQVAVDQLGTEETDKKLLSAINDGLYRYRRMGQDVTVAPAHYVSLDIEMKICVLPHYLRGHVKADLLDRFSNRMLPDGQYGFFHPDSLTFGEGIYLSKLVAAAQAVPGVASATVTKLERFHEGSNQEIENGILPLGPMEIAQLDNDPSFPEHGKLTLYVEGGR
jgi:predicted phage baseplate assembly protein